MLTVLVVGSALTVAYSIRFLWGAFGTRPGTPDTELARPPAAMLVPRRCSPWPGSPPVRRPGG
ncbi:hypothetical protein V2I01_23650 [Micromonospora sp. BRA006-A]|nr:hypothetical protein [Micromonospora sp. BRA006-A]